MILQSRAIGIFLFSNFIIFIIMDTLFTQIQGVIDVETERAFNISKHDKRYAKSVLQNYGILPILHLHCPFRNDQLKNGMMMSQSLIREVDPDQKFNFKHSRVEIDYEYFMKSEAGLTRNPLFNDSEKKLNNLGIDRSDPIFGYLAAAKIASTVFTNGSGIIIAPMCHENNRYKLRDRLKFQDPIYRNLMMKNRPPHFMLYNSE